MANSTPENHDNIPGQGCGPADTPPSALPSGMTLEAIIDFTGELEHLNELVLLHIDKGGGFMNTAAYFSTVQPILNLLEVEIRVRYQTGMTKNDMKLVIQDWIDQEICLLQ
ncbi:MAG: hypothetical protein M0Q92_14125 [Methanoregula sp.]|jgi:hypothetical protein|nr:hypothetical protein [Methanoregula sp.]